MAKFAELTDNDRINYIKDEFIKAIEEAMVDPTEIKKLVANDEKFSAVMAYIPQLKVPECNCGCCIAVEKLEGKIPTDLQPLVAVARGRCEARTY